MLVEGWLRIPSPSGGAPIMEIKSDNGPIPFPNNSLLIHRENEDETLNFTISPDLIRGTVTFQGTADYCSSWYCRPYWSQSTYLPMTVGFQPRGQPKFLGVPLRYHGSEPEYDIIKSSVGDAMLWDMYPLPDIGGGGYSALREPLPPLPPVTHHVSIEYISQGSSQIRFSPDTVSIDVNDSIRWTNNTQELREVKARPGPIDCPGSDNRTRMPFGSSFELAPDESLTRSYAMLGCVYYMSAEQTGVQGRVDIFQFSDTVIDADFYDLRHAFDRQNLGLDIETYRNGMSPRPDYLYGWLCCRNDNPYDDPVEYILGGSPPGTHSGHGTTEENFFQLTYAHENGHMFGLEHESGTIAPDIGWNVTDLMGRSGFVQPGHVKTADKTRIMKKPEGGQSAADFWIHRDNWNNVLTDSGVYPPEFGSGPSGGSGRVLPPSTPFNLISGIFPSDPLLPGTLRPVVRLENYIEVEPEGVGSAAIEIADDQAVVLYSTHFEPEPGEESAFSLPVPVLESARTIRLFRNGQLHDTITRSSNAPTVSIIEPETGDALGAVPFTVEWQASDADNEQLRVNVLYSPDEGMTWMPLRVGVGENSAVVRVNAADLPASDEGVIRVDASDGFNSASTFVTALHTGPNHPPTVAILTPTNGEAFKPGTNVVLSGTVGDLEDGWIDISTGLYIRPTVNWYSNVDGFLGAGQSIGVSSLSSGPHVLELRATDEDGATTSAFVAILVY